MYRLAITAIFGSLAVITSAAGQGKDFKKGEKAPPLQKQEAPQAGPRSKPAGGGPLPGEVDIHFLNGSNVRMVIQSPKLEIATVYGTLAVPIKDVRAIEFGIRYPEGYEAKIQAALKDLGSSQYRQREQASKALVDLGPFSYPAVYQLNRSKDSKDLETMRRAAEVLKKLKAAHPKKDLKTVAEDRVVTPTFTIAGRILTPSITANTEYFGEVVLSLAKMRTLRAVVSAGPEVAVTVDAAKYANAGQWLETEFETDGRFPLLITAKGTVDTWPQQPGQWVVGPNGQAARIGGGNVIVRRFGGPGVVAQAGGMEGGALYGKIGQDGQPFVIGERYEGTPDNAGKLYLHIGPSPWNCQSTGSYEVKIRRKD
jgi:hypothetical protein